MASNTVFSRLSGIYTGRGYTKNTNNEGPYEHTGKNAPSIPSELTSISKVNDIYLRAARSMDQGPLGTCGTFAIILAMSDARQAKEHSTRYVSSREHYDYDVSLNPYSSVNINNEDQCSVVDDRTWDGVWPGLYPTIVNNGATESLTTTLNVPDSVSSQYNRTISPGDELYTGSVTLFSYNVRRNKNGYYLNKHPISFSEYMRYLRINFLRIKEKISKGYGIICSIDHYKMPLDKNIDNVRYSLSNEGHAMSIYGVSGDTIQVRNSWSMSTSDYSGSYHTFTWYNNPANIMSNLRYVRYSREQEASTQIDVSPCIKGHLSGASLALGPLYDIINSLIQIILGI